MDANTFAPMDANRSHLQADRHPDGREREAELKEEIRFLRGLIEQRDRDAAELRAALRKALEAMPRALPSPASENAPEAPGRPANGGAASSMPEAVNGPQKPSETPKTGLSYADVLAELEANLG